MYPHIKASHHARQSYGLYGVVIKRQQGRAHENQMRLHARGVSANILPRAESIANFDTFLV